MSKQTSNSRSNADRSELLIVDTVYLDDMARFFRNTSGKAELELEQLLASLNSAKSNAVVSGEMAEALEAFIELAGQMRDKIREFGSSCAALAESFSEEIQVLDPPVT